MHTYRIHQLIRDRGKDRVVNVAQRNSVQQAINRLCREGWIEVQDTRQPANYPARVIYRITDAGTGVLHDWLNQMLDTPAREFPQFPAALSFLAILQPDQAAAQLSARRAVVAAEVEEMAASLEADLKRLPRVVLIEEEHALAIRRAELAWLESVISELEHGTLTWDTQALLAAAESYPLDP